jgi:hypothetical protein
MIIFLSILSGLLLAALVIALFGVRNLINKNEQLEDFITKQSEAIGVIDRRLKTLDDKNIFYVDDEIGWFFTEIKRLQEALNEFRLF